MIIKNRFEKLLFNKAYNNRNRGNTVGGMYMCIDDVPGKFYKTVYIGKRHTIMGGESTLWLLITELENKHYHVREAFVTEDMSCWHSQIKKYVTICTKEDLNVYIDEYKKKNKG